MSTWYHHRIPTTLTMCQSACADQWRVRQWLRHSTVGDSSCGDSAVGRSSCSDAAACQAYSTCGDAGLRCNRLVRYRHHHLRDRHCRLCGPLLPSRLLAWPRPRTEPALGSAAGVRWRGEVKEIAGADAEAESTIQEELTRTFPSWLVSLVIHLTVLILFSDFKWPSG